MAGLVTVCSSAYSLLCVHIPLSLGLAIALTGAILLKPWGDVRSSTREGL